MVKAWRLYYIYNLIIDIANIINIYSIVSYKDAQKHETPRTARHTRPIIYNIYRPKTVVLDSKLQIFVQEPPTDQYLNLIINPIDIYNTSFRVGLNMYIRNVHSCVVGCTFVLLEISQRLSPGGVEGDPEQLELGPRQLSRQQPLEGRDG